MLKDGVNRVSLLNQINNSLLPNAAVKILSDTLPTAFDFQHWEPVPLTGSMGVFYHKLLRKQV